MKLGCQHPAEKRLSRFWRTPDREVSVHLFRYRSGEFESIEHSHGESSITMALEHRLVYQIHGQVEQVHSEEVLVISPGEWHTGLYALSPAPLGLTISASDRALKLLLASMEPGSCREDLGIQLPRISGDRRLLYLAQEMAFEIQRRAPGSDLLLMSLVTQFLVHLLRIGLSEAAPRRRLGISRQLPAWEMVRAIECMNDYGKSSFSLGILCSEIGTSQSRFMQLFRQSTGASPLAFYNRLLINKARRLLTESTLSTKEISFELGFQSESHFCALFRAVSNVTPGRFRAFERGV